VDKKVIKLALCCGEWLFPFFSLSLALMVRARRNYKNVLDTTTFIDSFV